MGGTQTIHVNIRLITATNKDLETEAQAGRFRQDLYYRLNVIPIFMPALRERREDIPMLVKHFQQKSVEENRKKVKFISDSAMEYLMNYSWPGNVRELENAIERAVILCKGDTLVPELFPIPGNTQNMPALKKPLEEDFSNFLHSPLPESVANLEKQVIAQALQKTAGNQKKASEILGITQRMLGYKLKTYGIKP